MSIDSDRQPPAQVDSGDLTPFDRFNRGIVRFVHLEGTAGLTLIAATLAAMALQNSPWGELYDGFLHIVGQVRVGALSIEKPLFLWVNDGWMAIFFFVIGLEIKHELVHGHLADRSQLVLPLAGAIGGVAVPALTYVAINSGNPAALIGWAVPTATDIAFALGILAMLGPRVPVALKVFLMTLAILDDLVAIVIIALFYTSGLSLASLAAAAVVIALMTGLKLAGARSASPFILLGVLLWVCVLKSGVHATLAGVITALFITSEKSSDDPESPVKGLISDLHPWVAFVILPAFAFVNAGLPLAGLTFTDLLDPVPLGITLGLFVGKPVGILLCVGLVVAARLARLPDDVSWAQLAGVATLCGVGFTMSLFIGGLAFAEGGAGYGRIDRLGVLVGSLLSGIAGYCVLRANLRAPATTPG